MGIVENGLVHLCLFGFNEFHGYINPRQVPSSDDVLDINKYELIDSMHASLLQKILHVLDITYNTYWNWGV